MTISLAALDKNQSVHVYWEQIGRVAGQKLSESQFPWRLAAAGTLCAGLCDPYSDWNLRVKAGMWVPAIWSRSAVMGPQACQPTPSGCEGCKRVRRRMKP